MNKNMVSLITKIISPILFIGTIGTANLANSESRKFISAGAGIYSPTSESMNERYGSMIKLFGGIGFYSENYGTKFSLGFSGADGKLDPGKNYSGNSKIGIISADVRADYLVPFDKGFNFYIETGLNFTKVDETINVKSLPGAEIETNFSDRQSASGMGVLLGAGFDISIDNRGSFFIGVNGRSTGIENLDGILSEAGFNFNF